MGIKRFLFIFLYLSLIVLISSTGKVEASIIWDWSFDSNSGQFVTTGDAVGGIAPSGTYLITDFIVTNSGSGATLGSWSTGEYADTGYATNSPYNLVWDGSTVIAWHHNGTNTFDWIVFKDLAQNNYFFFGWETGNKNIPTQAVYFPKSRVSSDLYLNVSSDNSTPVPEPASLILGIISIGGVACLRKNGMIFNYAHAL